MAQMRITKNNMTLHLRQAKSCEEQTQTSMHDVKCAWQRSCVHTCFLRAATNTQQPIQQQLVPNAARQQATISKCDAFPLQFFHSHVSVPPASGCNLDSATSLHAIKQIYCQADH
jgi:hypothetical protein